MFPHLVFWLEKKTMKIVQSLLDIEFPGAEKIASSSKSWVQLVFLACHMSLEPGQIIIRGNRASCSKSLNWVLRNGRMMMTVAWILMTRIASETKWWEVKSWWRNARNDSAGRVLLSIGMLMMVVMVLALGKFPFLTISNPNKECLNHREKI